LEATLDDQLKQTRLHRIKKKWNLPEFR